jgi:large subunit ribosomal protein L21e
MVVKSHGPRKRTRELFRRSIKAPINEFLKEFKVGDIVVIDINSASQKGMPFKRFQGLPGEVIEKRGRAYVLRVKSGDATKTVIAKPEHIKKM